MKEMNLQEFLDLADRFLAEELNEEEANAFHRFRKDNPLYEKRFQEHLAFLNELNSFHDRLEFKKTLEHVMQAKKPIVVAFERIWNVMRINGVAAAAVAVVSSLATLYATGYFSSIRKTTSDYSALRREINNVKRNVNAQNTVIKNINDASKPGTEQSAVHYGATGFLLNNEGYAVTNSHVVRGADSIFLQNASGQSYKASIVFNNTDQDLAILKINDTSFKSKNVPYSFKQHTLDLGDNIFTIGYPRDEAVYGEGYLSSATGYAGDTLAYQISIPLNPGNSGGPVFDDFGNVIGIISGKQKGIDGAGFAIKTKALIKALSEIPSETTEDQSTEKITLNEKNTLSNASRKDQIKKVQDFIYLVKVY